MKPKKTSTRIKDILCDIVYLFCIYLCQICIAVFLCAFLMYSLSTSFKDVHIFLCAFGLYFLSLEAILNTNTITKCGTRKLVLNRSYTHGILQACGLVFTLTGTVMIGLEKEIDTPHGITGLVATTTAVVTGLTGIGRLFVVESSVALKIMHALLGISTVIISAVCIIMGILKPMLLKFFERHFRSWLVLFVVICTFLICIMSLIKTFRLTFHEVCDEDEKNKK